MLLGKLISYCLAGILSFALVNPGFTMTLAEAVALARSNDPVFLSAYANQSASGERSSQALASLLPQISATASSTSNRRVYEVMNSAQSVSEDVYNSNAAQLSLTQPLWRHANWIARSQAEAAAAQAYYQGIAAEQDLLMRLAQAWFDVMLARDVMELNSAQLKVAEQQWLQMKRAAEIELVGLVSLEEARSKFDQAAADYSNSEADQAIKVASLEQIVGRTVLFKPPALSEKFSLADPRKGTLEQWLQHAEEKSPLVIAALLGLEAASDEIRKQRSGHEPTLDMVATYGRNSQDAGTFPGQNGFTITQGTIALQLSVPIYSGGGQNAKVKEAVAMREKSRFELDAARGNVRQACKQAWFGWQAGNRRQAAAQQAIKFSSMSLGSAKYGKSRDLKIELDVLQARQQIAAAIRDLQKARYDMITSQLKLKAIAGELEVSDLTALDVWLVEASELSFERLLPPSGNVTKSGRVM